MKILGIETATTVCGVALLENGQVLAERTREERYAHAETLFGFLDDVLESSGVRLRDIQGVAVSIGPGSFTGLRIGLSAAKGLHMATGIPVIPVPTLEALAVHGAGEAEADGATSILTVLDARRDELYWQIHGITTQGVSPVTPVRDGQISDIAMHLPPGKVAVTGEAGVHTVAALEQAGVQASQLRLLSGPYARCSAAAVARLGASLYSSGAIADVATLEPRYIKEFFLRIPE